METHLSLSIDRLRQSASQEVLTVLFKEIKQFLQEMIKWFENNAQIVNELFLFLICHFSNYY